MKNVKNMIGTFSKIVSIVMFFIPVSSMALNYDGGSTGNYQSGHTKMIKDMIQLIKENEDSCQSPSGDAVRDSFNLALSQMREKLAELQCGLSNPYTPGTEAHCYYENENAMRLAEWEQRAADPTDPVYSIELTGTYEIPGETEEDPPQDTKYCYEIKYNPIGTCDYIQGTDFNSFDKVLIKDMRYIALSRNQNTHECFMDYDHDAAESDFISLDEVFGRYAGKVDDELKDSVLWMKPTNTRYGEARDQVIQAAADAAVTPLKVVTARSTALLNGSWAIRVIGKMP